MKIEHIVLNVADPTAMADWYCKHCGLRVIRHIPQPSQTHFLADTDATVLEVYRNRPTRCRITETWTPCSFIWL